MAMVGGPGGTNPGGCVMSISFPFSEEDLQISGPHEDSAEWWKTAMADETHEISPGSFLTGGGSTGTQDLEGFPVVYRRKSSTAAATAAAAKTKNAGSFHGEERIKSQPLPLRKVPSSESKSVGLAASQLERKHFVAASPGRRVEMEAAAERSPADSETGPPSAAQGPSRRKLRAGSAREDENKGLGPPPRDGFVKRRKLALVVDCHDRELHAPAVSVVQVTTTDDDEGVVVSRKTGAAAAAAPPPSRSTRRRRHSQHQEGEREQEQEQESSPEIAADFQRRKRLLLTEQDDGESSRFTRRRPQRCPIDVGDGCDPDDQDVARDRTDMKAHRQKLVAVVECHDRELRTSMSKLRGCEDADGVGAAASIDWISDLPTRTTRSRQRWPLESLEEVRGRWSPLRKPPDSDTRKEKLLSAIDCRPDRRAPPEFGVSEVEEGGFVPSRGLGFTPRSARRLQTFFQAKKQERCRGGSVDTLGQAQQPNGCHEDGEHRESEAVDPRLVASESARRGSDAPSGGSSRGRRKPQRQETQEEAEWGLDHAVWDALDAAQRMERCRKKLLTLVDCHTRELGPQHKLGGGGDDTDVAAADFGAQRTAFGRKKLCQVLRNGAQKPKTMAVTQLLVRLPPVQKRVDAVDPFTSNAGKYMSLKQLHDRFALKQQGAKRSKEGKAFGVIAAAASGRAHQREEDQLQSRAGLTKLAAGLLNTTTSLVQGDGGQAMQAAEATHNDLVWSDCAPPSPASNIVVELRISETGIAEAELQSLVMRGGRAPAGELCAEQGRSEGAARLCKRSPRTAAMLAAAMRQYESRHKAKVCQWKEFELGGVAPAALVGQSCKIYWPLDDEWYAGVVRGYNEQTRKHRIVYRDDEKEWAILAKERVKLKLSAAERLRLTAEPEGGNRRPDPDELAALAAAVEDFQAEPTPGDVVWARVKGYPMWPAYVMDEEHAKACGLECIDMLAVQFFGSYDYARIVARSVVLFSKGLLSKYHGKCKRAAFDQGLQEVEVYFKECRLPESMAHLQADSPESAVVGAERKRRDVDGDDQDFMGDERKYTIRKSVKSLFTLPLKLGSLVVLSLGKVVRDSEHFHDQRHIWTEGYTAVRRFTLSKDPKSAVEYLMEVVRNPRLPSHPLFRVTAAAGGGEAAPVIEGASPYACWKKLFSKLRKSEAKGAGGFAPAADREKRHKFRSGAAMFGFSNPRVAKLIQGLPHARTCSKFAGWADEAAVEEGQEDLLPAGYRPVEVQWKHLDRCTICYLDEEYVDNLLLHCDKCRIMVHMKCYGQLERPGGELWLCSLCDGEAPAKRPLCCLCPVTGGSMKRTTDGRWAHLTCAIWMPETRMVDARRMEPVDGVNAIHKERWSLTCTVCQVPYGACIQCADAHCRVAYHPLCARASSFRMEAVEETRKDGEVALRVVSYCPKHRRPKAQAPPAQAGGSRLPRDCASFLPPANPSGCARTEPYVPAARRCRGEPEAPAAARAKQHFVENMPFLASGRRGNLPARQESLKLWSRPSEAAVFSVTDKFHHMVSSLKRRLTFGKSAIHGWGVFSKQTHQANDMIIEYAGEVVRPAVADLREARRVGARVGAGTYMFRVDDERVVDATHSGTLAHLINHSCEPNCYSRLISVRSKDRIVIFAKREIAAGEELTYDYRFMSKDERLDCCCGCRRCRGTVNILDDGSEASLTLVPLKDLVKWDPPRAPA